MIVPVLLSRTSTLSGISTSLSAVIVGDANDPLIKYKLSDTDDVSIVKYYGYVDKDGNWYILESTATTARYIKGATNYPSNWSIRDQLVYDYYYNVF